MSEPADEFWEHISKTVQIRICQCPHPGHPHDRGQCTQDARVKFKVHAVGYCNVVHAQRPEVFDENGDSVQIMCAVCFAHYRTTINSSLLQVIQIAQAVGIEPRCVCGRATDIESDVLTILEEYR